MIEIIRKGISWFVGLEPMSPSEVLLKRKMWLFSLTAQDGVTCAKVHDAKPRFNTKLNCSYDLPRNVILINQFSVQHQWGHWSGRSSRPPTPPPEGEEAICTINPVLFPTLQKEGVLAQNKLFFLFLLLMASLPHLPFYKSLPFCTTPRS